MLQVTSSNGFSYGNTQCKIPAELANRIKKWSKDNLPDADISDNPHKGGSGREDDMHITVKFGLHTKDTSEVEEVLKGFGEFEVRLGFMTVFKSDGYDVLVIEAESDKLRELNKKISDNLKCTDTHPEYKPHATIAYVKKGKADQWDRQDAFYASTFTVRDIVFSDSDGVKTTFFIG